MTCSAFRAKYACTVESGTVQAGCQFPKPARRTSTSRNAPVDRGALTRCASMSPARAGRSASSWWRRQSTPFCRGDSGQPRTKCKSRASWYTASAHGAPHERRCSFALPSTQTMSSLSPLARHAQSRRSFMRGRYQEAQLCRRSSKGNSNTEAARATRAPSHAEDRCHNWYRTQADSKDCSNVSVATSGSNARRIWASPRKDALCVYRR
eukprot:6639466-Pyramimonas_sp.AAC.2